MTSAERCRQCIGLRPRLVGAMRMDSLDESDREEFHRVMGEVPEMTWERVTPSLKRLDDLFDFRLSHYRLHGFGPLALRDGASERLVGMCGFQVLDADDDAAEVELVVFIARSFWGSGLAEQAAGWFLAEGFERCGLRTIWATVRPENVRAGVFVRRLGFLPCREVEHYGFTSQLLRLDAARWPNIDQQGG